jgi:uncharacterized glyoxalase superfamily protein PhnB
MENLVKTKFAQPVPELPVADVEKAQQYYRDVLGFDINWTYADKSIGAVSRDNVAIFLSTRKGSPNIHWIFADDIDATFEEMTSRGARITEPLETKPWNLRQFSITDLDGNKFTFHHEIEVNENS